LSAIGDPRKRTIGGRGVSRSSTSSSDLRGSSMSSNLALGVAITIVVQLVLAAIGIKAP